MHKEETKTVPVKVMEAEVSLPHLDRIFEQLSRQTTVSPDGIYPLEHVDVPEGGFRIHDGFVEKWTPVYAPVQGPSVLDVVRGLKGGVLGEQTGWRVEKREITETCQCTSGHFQRIEEKLVHVDGCGRAVGTNPSETPEEWRERMLSIQKAPHDEYLNGMYPTLGGRDDKDPQSWITGGRSEYKRRTKGMIHWGSQSEDKPHWSGGTLPALQKVEDERKAKKKAELELAVEKWSKKAAPRLLGEL
jgi:hypothetical protein